MLTPDSGLDLFVAGAASLSIELSSPHAGLEDFFFQKGVAVESGKHEMTEDGLRGHGDAGRDTRGRALMIAGVTGGLLVLVFGLVQTLRRPSSSQVAPAPAVAVTPTPPAHASPDPTPVLTANQIPVAAPPPGVPVAEAPAAALPPLPGQTALGATALAVKELPTGPALPGAGVPAAAAPAPAAAVAAAAPVVSPVAAGEAASGVALDSCKKADARGKCKKTLELCGPLATVSSPSAELATIMAHASTDCLRAADALSWARKATESDPNFADAYVFLGGAEQDAGHNKEAKAAYKKYLELSPRGRYAADLRVVLQGL